MRTSGTVPETRRQRHCARGAAAGGLLYTRPFIRDRAPPTLAEGQPEAARGSRGPGPLRLLSPISCPHKKWGRLPGRDPAIPAAAGGTSGAPRRGAEKTPPGAARQIQDRRRGGTRQSPPPKAAHSERLYEARKSPPALGRKTQESPGWGGPRQSPSAPLPERQKRRRSCHRYP